MPRREARGKKRVAGSRGTGSSEVRLSWVRNHLQVLKLLRNTDHGNHHGIKAVKGAREKGTGRESIPGDVGAGKEPVVEH